MQRELSDPSAMGTPLMVCLWKHLVVRPKWSGTWPYQQFCRQIIVRSVDDESYPNCPDEFDAYEIPGWFKAKIWDLTENGLEVYSFSPGYADSQGQWLFSTTLDKPAEGLCERNIVSISRIPEANMVKFDPQGDEYQPSPHLWVKFANDGQPYDHHRYGFMHGQILVPLAPEKLRARRVEDGLTACVHS